MTRWTHFRNSELSASTSVYALSTALAMVVASSAAFGQDARPAAPAVDTAPEDIIVTGFRASLESSIRTKKNDLAIVESVTAEDIGKLPDVSIAESIARLPGLTAQRQDGRDQVISIRGLGPEFSTALLNGRQQVTTGDNRGVEFDQYPSELLNAVKVYKTPFAGLIGQGLAGTVDLQTIRPLDKSDRIMSIGARYERNSLKALNPDSSRSGYRASATFVDQFADDTIGIAIGLAATSAPTQNERFNAWGYPDDAGGNAILGGAKPYVQSNKLNRYGAVGTIEYKPSDNFSTAVDLFYSDFKEKQRLRGIEFPLFWDGDTVRSTTNTVENKLVTKATYTGVFAMQRNDYNQRDAETLSAGWYAKGNLGDKIRAKLDVSYSRAKRTDFLLESYTGTGFRSSGLPDTVVINRQPSGVYKFTTTLNYSDPNIFKLTDAQGWGGNAVQTGTPLVQAGFLNRPSFKDELKALRVDFEGDIDGSAFKGWELGANYSERQKDSAYTSFFLRLPNGATSLSVPSAALLKSNVSLDFLGIPQMLTYDPLYVYNNVYVPQADIRPGTIVRDYTVKEKVFTAYGQLNIDTQLGAYPVRGNLGLQMVKTNQSSAGKQAVTVTATNGVQTVTVLPVSGKDTYTNFLPSFSLNVEADDGVVIRFAAARTMARARLDQLRVQQDINFDRGRIFSNTSPYSSNSGNIELQPYIADGVDLSVEKYFGGTGYVALAGFFKRITNFVGQEGSLYDFGPIARASLGATDLSNIGANGGFVGPAARPANNGKGDLKGFEATVSVPFNLATEALDGFGFIGNISYATSSIKFNNSPLSLPVPGLSKWTQNATLYFEKAGFEVRGSYRHRSRFLGEISAISASRDFAIIEAEGIVDAQIGYSFQDGSVLEGLSIQLQGKNLTDEPYITYGVNKIEDLKDPRLVRDYQRYGRSFLLGATYKF
jgi:iron complex outermembrane recepter protein